MGGNWSSVEREPSPDPWWPAPQPHSDQCNTDQDVQQQEANKTTEGDITTRESRGQVRQKELEMFKEELAQKRALRHEALSALQAELLDLRSRVAQSDELQQQLRDTQEENKKLALEKEELVEQLSQKAALEKQVQALKDVSEIGKEMLRIRELQVKELKKKLVEINISSVTAPPEDLRIEYEKQIENIRKLRTLYEERAAATLIEHRRQLEREEAKITVLETQLSELKKETDEYNNAKNDLEEKIKTMENTLQEKEDELALTKDKLFSTTVQNKSLNSQINLINNLFSQMLVSPKVDLDRLIRLLKENHGLITDLTQKGDSNEVAALLVDLAGQVEKEKEEEKTSESSVYNDATGDFADQIEGHEDGSGCSQSDIASNLSKVWKVMIELLSHHQNSNQTEISGGAESCYKSIQTSSGPRSVISVSQTFITLKDLIVEKNRLVKEVGRLKTLNSHLEHRLGSQEKRLLVVTSELRKTWGVVNKLKAQHKQLHTHEKILRYELQQKRCMLNELKIELDHCRDKWEQARQKNSQTEEDWKKLRKEFAARKSRTESNSAESGYEEEDVAQSPSSEPIGGEESLFVMRQNEGNEPELSEEDIEHSDGNSFDTVIDLLDIACIENQVDNGPEVTFVLCEAPSETPELFPSLLPLSGSEFTEGLDQIESEDLAAVLDVQYQNQLLGADYNLSLPSSSVSSPIPTENDEFVSSEMDVSEEDSSSNDNHVYSTPLPVTSKNVSEDQLLFGSKSSTNISKFLEGLFTDQENTENKIGVQQNLNLDMPSTSQIYENEGTNPKVNDEICFQIPGSTYTQASDKKTSEVLSQKLNLDKCHSSSKNGLHEASVIAHQSTSISKTPEIRQESEKILAFQSEQKPLLQQEKRPEKTLEVRSAQLERFEDHCSSSQRQITSENPDEINDMHFSPDSRMTHLSSVPKLHSSPELGTVSISDAKGRTPEQILEDRTERFKRLEEQCKSLVSKMSATSLRSEIISNKLDELHSCYGSTESASSGDEQSSSSTDGRVRSSSSSPRHKRRMTCSSEEKTSNEELCGLPSSSNSGSSIEERVNFPQTAQLHMENNGSSKGNNTDVTKKTPEEILQARAQRLNRLEEQCKSLFSKMSATSQRSDAISNKLEELHEQYGQPSTSGNKSHKNETSTSASTEDTIEPEMSSDRELCISHASGMEQMERRDPSTGYKKEGAE